MYRKHFKRLFDVVLSFIGIILLSPIFLITALLVRMNLGSPVIFKQQRVGKNEKIFTIYKFRTMTDKRDENNELLPDELRLTKFGKFLRSTSIDELPELFNIIKGNMSIVGPRPLLVRYLPYYTDYERLRHTVRPGITGIAQISGRNLLVWKDRLNKDVQYTQNIKFIVDMKIIFATAVKVIKRKDIVPIYENKLMDLDEMRKGIVYDSSH